MNKKFAFFAAATALTAIIAAPVLSSPLASNVLQAFAGETHSESRAVLVSDNDHHNGKSWSFWRGGDDDEGEGDDDDGGNAATAAPVGTVAPPANGLFNNNGAKPQVQVN